MHSFLTFILLPNCSSSAQNLYDWWREARKEEVLTDRRWRGCSAHTVRARQKARDCGWLLNTTFWWVTFEKSTQSHPASFYTEEDRVARETIAFIHTQTHTYMYTHRIPLYGWITPLSPRYENAPTQIHIILKTYCKVAPVVPTRSARINLWGCIFISPIIVPITQHYICGCYCDFVLHI